MEANRKKKMMMKDGRSSARVGSRSQRKGEGSFPRKSDTMIEDNSLPFSFHKINLYTQHISV